MKPKNCKNPLFEFISHQKNKKKHSLESFYFSILQLHLFIRIFGVFFAIQIKS